MRRALLYAVMLGLMTGALAGVALFGLSLGTGDAGAAPGALERLVLSLGLGVADATLAAGAALTALVLLVATLDLRRVARRRRC